jgi:hypothetical protein
VATKTETTPVVTSPRPRPPRTGGYLQTPYLLSYAYERKAPLSRGYPLCKSFRRNILQGYLRRTPFVFIELARKRVFWVYTLYPSVNIAVPDVYAWVNTLRRVANCQAVSTAGLSAGWAIIYKVQVGTDNRPVARSLYQLVVAVSEPAMTEPF